MPQQPIFPVEAEGPTPISLERKSWIAPSFGRVSANKAENRDHLMADQLIVTS